jgi:hypothetical protein
MKKVQDYTLTAFALVMSGYFIYLVSKRFLTDHISQNNIQYTKAVIIDDRNYNGNSRVKFDFTYSYSFIMDGKKYKGDSHDQNVKIGDSIEVEYDKEHPSINKPLHPKE